MFRLPAMFCLLLALAAPARAELSPAAYESMLRGATEVFDVEVIGTVRGAPVTRAEGRSSVTETPLKVRVRVLAVVRSAQGVKPGDTVTIAYTHYAFSGAPMPGPSRLPMVEKGERMRAFLNAWQGAYVPAAYGRSFMPLDGASPAR